MDTNQYKTQSEIVERATFIGPIEKSKEVMLALFDQGWQMGRTGPEIDRETLKTTGRFLFIAERPYIEPGCARCDEEDEQRAEAQDGLINSLEISGLL
jgi:hypothetical protein